jgi:hypothetical protein
VRTVGHSIDQSGKRLSDYFLAMQKDQFSVMGSPRLIVGFHQDEENHWVAELECGHSQHVRHDPPWQLRPWVKSPEGRESFIGKTLACVECARASA